MFQCLYLPMSCHRHINITVHPKTQARESPWKRKPISKNKNWSNNKHTHTHNPKLTSHPAWFLYLVHHCYCFVCICHCTCHGKELQRWTRQQSGKREEDSPNSSKNKKYSPLTFIWVNTVILLNWQDTFNQLHATLELNFLLCMWLETGHKVKQC